MCSRSGTSGPGFGRHSGTAILKFRFVPCWQMQPQRRCDRLPSHAGSRPVQTLRESGSYVQSFLQSGRDPVAKQACHRQIRDGLTEPAKWQGVVGQAISMTKARSSQLPLQRAWFAINCVNPACRRMNARVMVLVQDLDVRDYRVEPIQASRSGSGLMLPILQRVMQKLMFLFNACPGSVLRMDHRRRKKR